MKTKKNARLAGRAASSGGGKLEALCDCTQNITPEIHSQASLFPAERQQKLSELDAAMAAADLAGDFDAYVDLFQAWLDTFCNEAGHGG